MNKKITIILIFLLLLSIIFSGCLEEPKSVEENSNSSDNQPPIGSISAPEKVYFGETIEFDASKSYDSDGRIVSYNWDFGDEETADGVKVKHIYRFENEFDIDYPLIYPIYLFVEDDDGSTTATVHQIQVYPKEYIFYLSSQKLTTKKPSSAKDKIRGSGLFKLGSPQVITYALENSVTVQKCTWNATVYLKKPLFTIANKISVILCDNEGNEITKKELKLGRSILWREKIVQIRGAFDKEEEFRSVKIVVYGFSLRKEIGILYGGEKASYICFDFTT